MSKVYVDASAVMGFGVGGAGRQCEEARFSRGDMA
jgi:hypothetical protein